MTMPLKHSDISRLPGPGPVCGAAAGSEQRLDPRCGTSTESDTMIELPRRPDATVLSESIPLFYIGRNKHGFWVAREAQGRSGGLFLFRRSAARFAQKKSVPAGCAVMILTEPFELDLKNRGSRFVESLAATIDIAGRRVPTFVAVVGTMVAEWRKLVAQISRTLAGERKHREAIERELFLGQYILSSKSDDDLPIP